MMRVLIICGIVSLISFGTVIAQVPVTVDLGVGGGLSLPVSKLSDATNAGFHLGVKARIAGMIPLHFTGSANYNRLTYKVGSDAFEVWMLGAGIEYPIPSVSVTPYLALDGLLDIMTNMPGISGTRKSIGVGFGVGVGFPVPGFGNIDASAKYQFFNVLLKEGEETVSQIGVTVLLMFGVM